jgi:hypothetical protein
VYCAKRHLAPASTRRLQRRTGSKVWTRRKERVVSLSGSPLFPCGCANYKLPGYRIHNYLPSQAELQQTHSSALRAAQLITIINMLKPSQSDHILHRFAPSGLVRFSLNTSKGKTTEPTQAPKRPISCWTPHHPPPSLLAPTWVSTDCSLFVIFSVHTKLRGPCATSHMHTLIPSSYLLTRPSQMEGSAFAVT